MKSWEELSDAERSHSLVLPGEQPVTNLSHPATQRCQARGYVSRGREGQGFWCTAVLGHEADYHVAGGVPICVVLARWSDSSSVVFVSDESMNATGAKYLARNSADIGLILTDGAFRDAATSAAQLISRFRRENRHDQIEMDQLVAEISEFMGGV